MNIINYIENADPTGTGVLFYEFVRIKQELQQNNFIFWAFENVFGMKNIDRDKITT